MLPRFIVTALVLGLAIAVPRVEACDPNRPMYLNFQRLAAYYSKAEKKYFIALLATDDSTRDGGLDAQNVHVLIERTDGKKITIKSEDLIFVHLGSLYNQMAERYTFFRFNLILDNSYSIDPPNLRLIQDVTAKFIDRLPKSFEAQVILFSTEIKKSPFIKDKDQIKAAIRDEVPHENTALYDAVAMGVDELKFSGDDVPLKFSVVLTDGMDNESTQHADANAFKNYIVQQTTDQGIPLFIVGVGEEVDHQLLKEIAGFGLYQPIDNFPDVDTAFDTVHQIIDNTYVLKVPGVSTLDEIKAFYLYREDALTKKPVTFQDICLQ